MSQARRVTQREMQTARVSPASLTRLFTLLDSDGDGRVTLEDLTRFCLKNHLTYELEVYDVDRKHGGEDDDGDASIHLPPSVEEQTHHTITRMFFDAIGLRSSSLLSKASHGGGKDPSLTIADLTTAFQIRTQKMQQAETTTTPSAASSADRILIPSSVFRPQWIEMLLKVVPHPFMIEPSQDHHRKTNSTHRRGVDGRQPVEAMYEREAAHAASVATARATFRSGAPIGTGRLDSEFNPTTYTHHPPIASTSSQSYTFTQPKIRSKQLTQEYLTHRSAQIDRARVEEENALGARKRKLKNIARALDARAAQAQYDEEAKYAGGGDTMMMSEHHSVGMTDSDDDGISSPVMSVSGGVSGVTSRPSMSASLERISGETLDSSRLQLISFRTRDEYDATIGAERLKSEALDYKPDSSAQKQAADDDADDGGDGDEMDLLAKTLHAMNQPKVSNKDGPPILGETPQQRVARVLKSQRASHSTSGQFKAHRFTQPMPFAAIQPPPRPISADTRLKPVEYDDQGRPIRTMRRHALTERLGTKSTAASSPTTPHRQQQSTNDQLQAALLSHASTRVLESYPIDDPLESMLRPYVPESVKRRPTEALDEATARVPLVANQTSRTNRKLMNNGVKGGGVGKDSENGDDGPTPHVDWIRPEREDANGTNQFHLHFHLASTQDERLHAAQSLSVFRSSDTPTIANGGITSLAQLRPGGLQGGVGGVAGKAAILDIFNRDAKEGDISLLPGHSTELKLILARRALDSARPKFRLDFAQHRTKARQAIDAYEANVITRDGGLTTAEESEKWRQAQMGWGLGTRSSIAAAASDESRHRALHDHTRGKVVYTNHLAPGAHTIHHHQPFTTLLQGASPLDSSEWKFSRLDTAEREEIIKKQQRRQGEAKQQQSQKEESTALKNIHLIQTRPSERKRLKSQEEKKMRLTQFPFKSLYGTE